MRAGAPGRRQRERARPQRGEDPPPGGNGLLQRVETSRYRVSRVSGFAYVSSVCASTSGWWLAPSPTSSRSRSASSSRWYAAATSAAGSTQMLMIADATLSDVVSRSSVSCSARSPFELPSHTVP